MPHTIGEPTNQTIRTVGYSLSGSLNGQRTEGCPTLQELSRMYTTHIKRISAHLLLSDRKYKYMRFEHKTEHHTSDNLVL